jgi:hypothetical protein
MTKLQAWERDSGLGVGKADGCDYKRVAAVVLEMEVLYILTVVGSRESTYVIKNFVG